MARGSLDYIYKQKTLLIGLLLRKMEEFTNLKFQIQDLHSHKNPFSQGLYTTGLNHDSRLSPNQSHKIIFPPFLTPIFFPISLK